MKSNNSESEINMNTTKKEIKKKVKIEESIKKPERQVKDKQHQDKKEEERVVYAKAKYVPGSPRKTRLVVDLVRGRKAEDALTELNYIKKRASGVVKKVIKSAISNAENNFEMDRKNLVIVEAYVDKAPTFKRGRAGSRGRYKKILKRNSSIVIGLVEKST